MNKITATVLVTFTLTCLVCSTHPAIAGQLIGAVTTDQTDNGRSSLATPNPTGSRALISALLEAEQHARTLDRGSDYISLGKSSLDPQAYFPLAETLYVWDGVQWSAQTRITYTYSNGKMATMTTESFDGAEWYNFSRLSNSYSGDNLTQTLQQAWTGAAWVDTLRFTMTYDGSNRLSTSQYDEWNGSAWDPQTLTTFTYDGSSRVATTTIQNWAVSQWVNDGRTTYTYNGAGNESHVLIEQYSGGNWVAAYQTDYTYNGSDQLTTEVSQYWNGFWNDLNKSEYEYDGAGDETLARNFTWITSDWFALEVDTMKYDGSHRMTQLVNFNILSTLLSKDDYTYDGSGNLTEVVNQLNFGAGYSNNERHVYSYIQLAVAIDDAELPSQFQLMQNQPNPFNPETTIRFALAKPAQVSIEVFNVLGQLVNVLEDGHLGTGVYETSWDGKDSNGNQVASGVYFYRLRTAEIVQTRKMVLMR